MVPLLARDQPEDTGAFLFDRIDLRCPNENTQLT